MIGLIVILLIGGLFLWAIPQLPLDPQIVQWIRVLVLVVLGIYVILFVASLFGIEFPGTLRLTGPRAGVP